MSSGRLVTFTRLCGLSAGQDKIVCEHTHTHDVPVSWRHVVLGALDGVLRVGTTSHWEEGGVG